MLENEEVYTNRNFRCLQPLVTCYPQIRDEALKIKKEYFVLPNDDYHEAKGQWGLYGLWAAGRKIEENCRTCPLTTYLVQAVPHLCNVGFGLLETNSHLLPHRGAHPRLRFHLGLTENEHAYFKVNGHVHYWGGGSLLAFNNTDLHEAVNKGRNRRIILIIDLLTPEEDIEKLLVKKKQ
jgi:aspartyl/asparaginyl beta-hydroxylase (cupin superfamily)